MYAERLKENRIPYKVVSVKMTVDGNEEVFYLRELSVGQKYRIYKDYFENGEEDLVSVSLVSDHPLHIRTVEGNGKLKKLLNCSSTCRRQDMPPFYRINGCIYINNLNELNDKTSFNDNSVPYIMEQSHSVDIDDLADFYLAEYYLGNIDKNKESVM